VVILELRTNGSAIAAIAGNQAWRQQGEGFFAATAGCTAILFASAIFVAPAVFQVERRLAITSVIGTQQEPHILFASSVVVTTGGQGDIVAVLAIAVRVCPLGYGGDGDVHSVIRDCRVTGYLCPANLLTVDRGDLDHPVFGITAAVGRRGNFELTKQVLTLRLSQAAIEGDDIRPGT